MPTTAAAVRTATMLGLALGALGLVTSPAQAQQSATATVTASVTVLPPVQPGILRESLARSSQDPRPAGTSMYVDFRAGAQVSTTRTPPPAAHPDARTVQTVTIAFVGS